MRWFAASIESSCAVGSWSSTWLQCTVTRSPGFQLRTAEPTRRTTPDAPLPPDALLAEALEEPERGQRLEDRRPHRVEVDRARHHRDVRLVGRELGDRDVVDVGRLARVLLVGRDAGEHLLLVGPDDRGPEALRQRERAQLVAGGLVEDGGANRVDLGSHGA